MGRDFRNFNEEDFKLDLMAQPWSRIYESKHVNVIAILMNYLFLGVLDKHAPKQ